MSILRLRGIAFKVVVLDEVVLALICSVCTEVKEVVIPRRVRLAVERIWIDDALTIIRQGVDTDVFPFVDQVVRRRTVFGTKPLIWDYVFGYLSKIDEHARAWFGCIDAHHDFDVVDVIVVEVRVELRQQPHHSTPDLRAMLLNVACRLLPYSKTIRVIPTRVILIDELRIRVIDTANARIKHDAYRINIRPSDDPCTIRIHIGLRNVGNELLIPERACTVLHRQGIIRPQRGIDRGRRVRPCAGCEAEGYRPTSTLEVINVCHRFAIVATDR